MAGRFYPGELYKTRTSSESPVNRIPHSAFRIPHSAKSKMSVVAACVLNGPVVSGSVKFIQTVTFTKYH